MIAPIHDGWLYVLIEVFRALTVIAGASCAARLIKVWPRYRAVAARSAGVQALLSFTTVIPFTAFVALSQNQAGGLISLLQPLLLPCFVLTHRYLNRAEEEANA